MILNDQNSRRVWATRSLVETGLPIRRVSGVQDLSERKRTEQELRTSEAQYSNALRIAYAGHWEYDIASDTFMFNDKFERIFGITTR